MYIYISEFLLYLCFTITIGSTFMNFIPNNLKPTIQLSHHIVYVAAFGIPLFSFFSLLYNVVIISRFQEMGIWQLMPDVLRDLEFGKAWFRILIMSGIMLILMSFRDPQQDKRVNGVVGLILVGIIFYHGWASHPAGLSDTWGFGAQSIHVLAISIWAGILLIVGWFAKDQMNWTSFLKWFTPLSIGCIIVLTVGGIVMMYYIVPDLLNSWAVTYGQALLMKHLLYIPIILFGFGNGFLLKAAIGNNRSINVRKWIRIESIFIVAVFAITGFLNIQTPPHPPEEGNAAIPTSLIFNWFHGDKPYPQFVQWQWSVTGLVCATLFLFMTWNMIRTMRLQRYGIAVYSGVGIVVFGYLFLMLSVT